MPGGAALDDAPRRAPSSKSCWSMRRGRCPGSGRKQGAPNKITAEVKELAHKQGPGRDCCRAGEACQQGRRIRADAAVKAAEYTASVFADDSKAVTKRLGPFSDFTGKVRFAFANS
jgi:hypothetical protein